MDKNLAIEDFRKMIKNSWTYKRLSTQESIRLEQTFDDLKCRMHGDYKERWDQLNNIYSAFLNALGYLENPIYWREENVCGSGTK